MLYMASDPLYWREIRRKCIQQSVPRWSNFVATVTHAILYKYDVKGAQEVRERPPENLCWEKPSQCMKTGAIDPRDQGSMLWFCGLFNVVCTISVRCGFCDFRGGANFLSSPKKICFNTSIFMLFDYICCSEVQSHVYWSSPNQSGLEHQPKPKKTHPNPEARFFCKHYSEFFAQNYIRAFLV